MVSGQIDHNKSDIINKFSVTQLAIVDYEDSGWCL